MQPRRYALVGHFHSAEDIVDFDEASLDAVGGSLVDSTSIDFTYDDGAGTITAVVLPEFIQDTVGTMLTDSSSIDFTYTDGGVGLGTFTATVIAAGVDHGGLAGLSDDDHPQYPLAASTETISGAWTFSTNPSIENTNPFLELFDTNSSANAGRWYVQGSADLFRIFAVNDAENASTAALSITRSGATPTALLLPIDSFELQLGAGQDLRLYHDGTDSFITNATGKMRMPQDLWLSGAAQRSLYFEDTSATSGERVWRLISSGGDMFLQGRTDADAGAFTALQIERSGSSVTNALWTIDGLLGVQSTIGGLFLLNSTNANGPYMTFAKSGTAVGDIGQGNQLGTYTSGALAMDSRGNTLELGTNAVRRLSISPSTGFVWLPADNQELQLGAGNDLRLYHDGTNSIIRNDTGTLNFLLGSTVTATLRTGSTDAFEVLTGGIKTASPNTAAVPWRLGSVSVVSPTTHNRTLEVLVNGTLYYIAAKTTND